MVSTNLNIPEKDLKLKVILVSEHKQEGTEERDQSLRKYKEEFLYANIEKDEFDYTFKTNQTFKEVKLIISNITKFHPKMMSIGKWVRYDEKDNVTYFTSVDYKDTDTLYNSCFNQPYTETRYLYIIIDKNKYDSHQILNDIYKDSNKKYEETNRKNTELINEKKILKKQINYMTIRHEKKFQNIEKNYEKRIKNMENSYEKKIERIKNENSRKIEENYQKAQKEFELHSNIEKEKNKIAQEQLMNKIKNIEDKQRMEKEEEIKNEKEAELEFNTQLEEIKFNFYNELEKKLIVEIKKFCYALKETKNNINLLNNRLVKLLHNNYEALSLKIYEQSKQSLSLKTEELYKNNLLLFLDDQFNGNNHINTIAIGQAGVGKSTLINNILKIKGTEMEAKTGEGKSVTKNCKIYTSEKVPFLRVYDTPMLDFKLSIKELFQNIRYL